MNIPTGEFRALSSYAAAYTELSDRVDSLTDLVEDEMVPLVRTVVSLAEDSGPPRRKPARHAVARPRRHVRFVRECDQ